MQLELNTMSIDKNTPNNNYTNYEFQPLQVFHNVVKLFSYKQKFISSTSFINNDGCCNHFYKIKFLMNH